MADTKDILANLLAGFCSGNLSAIIGQPFDTLKVRLQTNNFSGPKNLSTFGKLLLIQRQEGARALYRGSFSPIVAQSISGSLLFGIIFSFKQYAEKKHREESNEEYSHNPLSKVSFASYILSAIAETVVYTPLELIKIRSQVHNASKHTQPGIIDLCKEVVKDDGLRGFYRGANFILLRETIGNSVFFISYFYSKETLASLRGTEPNLNSNIVLSGIVANITYWTTIYPVDVYKSNIQLSKKGGFSIKDMDVRNLYRGITPTLFRAVPVGVVNFLCFENIAPPMKRFLEKNI